MSNHVRTDFDHARDELYRQIHRCNVLQATPEQQQEWLRDTMDYLQDQYPILSERQIGELKMLGERFCQPAIPHGRAYTEVTREEWEEEAEEETLATV